MGTPISPVVRGLLNGVAIATQIRRQALEEEDFKLRKERIAQERQLRDVDITDRLLSAGRPVYGNAVLGDAVDETIPGGAPGFTAGSMAVPRPADRKRVVKYKRGDGEQVAVELYTPEERLKRAREQKALDDESEARSKVASARATLPVEIDAKRQIFELPVTIPGFGTVPMGAIGPLLNLRGQVEATTRARVNQEAANKRFVAGKQIDAAEKAKDRASRERTAAIRAGGARADAAANREADKVRQTETRIYDLDKELATLDEQAQHFGDLSKVKEGEAFTYTEGQGVKSGTMTRQIQNEFAKRARELKSKADRTREERKRLAGAIGWGAGDGKPNPYR